MKKTLIIFISIMMSFTLFGCANQTDTIGQQNQDTGEKTSCIFKNA